MGAQQSRLPLQSPRQPVQVFKGGQVTDSPSVLYVPVSFSSTNYEIYHKTTNRVAFKVKGRVFGTKKVVYNQRNQPIFNTKSNWKHEFKISPNDSTSKTEPIFELCKKFSFLSSKLQGEVQNILSGSKVQIGFEGYPLRQRAKIWLQESNDESSRIVIAEIVGKSFLSGVRSEIHVAAGVDLSLVISVNVILEILADLHRRTRVSGRTAARPVNLQ